MEHTHGHRTLSVTEVLLMLAYVDKTCSCKDAGRRLQSPTGVFTSMGLRVQISAENIFIYIVSRPVDLGAM